MLLIVLNHQITESNMTYVHNDYRTIDKYTGITKEANGIIVVCNAIFEQALDSLTDQNTNHVKLFSNVNVIKRRLIVDLMDHMDNHLLQLNFDNPET